MSDQLQGKKIAILVANEGVEQIELTSPLAALREAGAEVDLLAPDDLDAFNAKLVEEFAEGVHEGHREATSVSA